MACFSISSTASDWALAQTTGKIKNNTGKNACVTSKRKGGRKLYNTVALLCRDGSESRSINHSGGAVEAEVEVAPVERPQRVIHEVVGVEAELQLLALADIEVLEQSQVGVDVSRSVDDRQSGGTVLADLVGECEATRVDELVRREIRSGVAGNDRRQRNVRRAEQRGSADIVSSAWNLGAVESQAEILAPPSREVDATLELRDSGNLPAIE